MKIINNIRLRTINLYRSLKISTDCHLISLSLTLCVVLTCTFSRLKLFTLFHLSWTICGWYALSDILYNMLYTCTVGLVIYGSYPLGQQAGNSVFNASLSVLWIYDTPLKTYFRCLGSILEKIPESEGKVVWSLHIAFLCTIYLR